jgi:ABC-type lipoprotein release transport system permease subunit
VSGRRDNEETEEERSPPDPEELNLGSYGYILAQARSNPLRTGATMTAVAVAVVFLIIVSSISVGLEGATERELLDYTVGTPELPIPDFIQTEEGEFVGLFATRLFDPEDVNGMRLEAQSLVGSAQDIKVYPYSERVLGRSISSGLTYNVERLVAVDPSVGLTTPYTSYHSFSTLANGEYLSDVGAREVVLGYQLRDERFPSANVGDTIDLIPEGVAWFEADVIDLRSSGALTLTSLPGLRNLKLVGVLDRDLGTDHNAYVPLGLFANETGSGWTTRGPRCEAVSAEVKVEGVDVDALASMLEGRSSRVSSYFVTRSGATTATELAEDLRENIYSWLILALSVIVVGMVIGVANTAFLSVSQRVREIGTLRALGLSKEQVGRLVLWEALFVGMMGGVVGFFTGHILTSSVLTTLFEIEGLGILLAPGRTVPVIVLVSIFVVLGATLIGAWIPSRRAAELTPIEALSSPI